METLKIIKIGGNIIDNEEALMAFIKDFSAVEGHKILVHGGGKIATKLAEQMQIPVKMIDGRRVTDKATLDIITMVYAGKINKNIVAQLQANYCNAVGFTGADGNTIVSIKRPIKTVDYGFVGDIKQVNFEALDVLLKNEFTPVFCAITHDLNGQLLNTNADTIASELAIAFALHYNTELYYCFEKNGVLRDINDENSVIEQLNIETYQQLKADGVIADGMLPKLDNSFKAIDNYISKVCIGKTDMLFKTDSKHTSILR